ncbi:phenylalanine--tRNA ligase subunit beta [Buchnera aphidicola (Chaitoregma tattakana)]|uniref:phenylalanine--tRNA ligase subunit beta n=1 Tax=Buchnera aphidicola TaxID=9 RepID=UPI0031B87F50
MKISTRWIAEWSDFKLDVNSTCKSLTDLGIEVENCSKVSVNISDFFIGQIFSKETIFIRGKKFFLYYVLIKNNEKLKIYSTYKCLLGQKFIVSRSKIFFSENVYKYLKKYHSSISEIFFCSPFSLGISNVKNIPIKLDSSFDFNMNLCKKFVVYDSIIKLNIPYNRIEELNVTGILREIYVYKNIKFSKFKKKFIKSSKNKKHTKIFLEKSIKNYCYLGRKFTGLDISIKTPSWICERLKIFNINSNNILFDIINYVYLELGESFHVLDSNCINKKIFIKVSKNSKISDSSNNYFFLKKNNIIICNKKEILVFGNNFNSKYSNVNVKTKNIFLGSLFLENNVFNNYTKNSVCSREINYFHYSSNYDMQFFALKYITKIILRICGGTAHSIINIENFEKHNKNIIFLKKKNIKRIMGLSFVDNNVEQILHVLGYKFFKQKIGWKVLVPVWKKNIIIEEDIISDIVRVYGLDKIPATAPYEKCNITYKNFHNNNFIKDIKNLLVSIGYYEVLNYSFIDNTFDKMFTKNINNIKILNPISKNMSTMRSSLLPGLLKNFIFNNNRQHDNIKIFELGLCYFKNFKSYLGISEKMFLSCLLVGNTNFNWDEKTRKVDFYDIKGDLEYITENLRLHNNIRFVNKKIMGLEKNVSAYIFLEKKLIGKIGKLDLQILKKNNFNRNVDIFLFEICLEDFCKLDIYNIKKISGYPSIVRDVSIIVNNFIKYDDLLKFCKQIFFKYLVDIYIFDFYNGPNLSYGKKSISIRLTFQSINKTLKENYIDKIFVNNIKLLKKKFGAIVKNR